LAGAHFDYFKHLAGKTSEKPNTPRRTRLGLFLFIRRVRFLLSYVGRYDDKSPKEALGLLRPRACRVLACCAQGPVVCGIMHSFSPEATSSWSGAASSLACSRLPPAPRVRMATLVLSSRTATSSTPSSRAPDAMFTPVRGRRTGTSTSGVSFLGSVLVCTCRFCC